MLFDTSFYRREIEALLDALFFCCSNFQPNFLTKKGLVRFNTASFIEILHCFSLMYHISCYQFSPPSHNKF